MTPFYPRQDWYEKYWYSNKPAKKPWPKVASAIVTVAAWTLAVLFR